MVEQGRTAAGTKVKRRAVLTREAILEAAMRLCSPEGGGVLTFSRLGKELGADPTAVYRHFRDKDELVLALTDLLIEESLALAARSAPERDHWRDWLTATAHAIRAVHLARPALAVLCATRTTASPAETRSVEEIIGVLHHAGLPVIEAAECYRMLLDLTLAFVQSSAAFLTLAPEAQAKDDAAWAVKYGLLPADRFPMLHQSSPRLTELFRSDEEVFRLVLETFLDGVALKIERARPATC
ncbi:TetR/AcrR family transcriptional regulator [Streptomyces sp. PTM05]|uniref:TetR/AcrR family transcriptional regulator n=1 Tax=Streptantibioticus parmotrematis TaxID=2873249 RepID=A0ABS7R0D4_9ACTN|nr:TetR/AcrR family transcriptional regulator C-terminal domain-containing protein [Streptantibioticus parmotrematis]MBY8888421.1 TetR/AcrR family transcriptional regulator [Streptantibioticus parmotrematis]